MDRVLAHELAEKAVNEHGALQKISELEWLIKVLCTDSQPKSILEIGSWKGGTLWLWMQLAEKVWSIDPFLLLNLEEWDETRLTVITAYSGEAIRRLSEPVFDVVFIDGDHSAAGVRNDWELYSQIARKVVFHDIVPWTPTPAEEAERYYGRGVYELWEQIKLTHRTYQFIDPSSQTLKDGRVLDTREGGIGVVYMD